VEALHIKTRLEKSRERKAEGIVKIILIGASGTLGKAIAAELSARHEIVAVGKTSGDLHADIRDLKSLQALFQKTGKVDAFVSAAGSVHFGPWEE
jgi:nucleoside-diphosphate-sugar epimerase